MAKWLKFSKDFYFRPKAKPNWGTEYLAGRAYHVTDEVVAAAVPGYAEEVERPKTRAEAEALKAGEPIKSEEDDGGGRAKDAD